MLPMAAYQYIDDICDDFKLERDQITIVRLLGTGNFGQVSKAIYGALRSEVAVKTLNGNCIFCFSYLCLLYVFFISSIALFRPGVGDF